jgi:hypothetical protein
MDKNIRDEIFRKGKYSDYWKALKEYLEFEKNEITEMICNPVRKDGPEVDSLRGQRYCLTTIMAELGMENNAPATDEADKQKESESQ